MINSLLYNTLFHLTIGWTAMLALPFGSTMSSEVEANAKAFLAGTSPEFIRFVRSSDNEVLPSDYRSQFSSELDFSSFETSANNGSWSGSYVSGDIQVWWAYPENEKNKGDVD